MSLLVSVLVVIRNILVEVLEGSPAVEAVPEVVKFLNLLPGGIDIAKGRDGVVLGETGLSLEYLTPKLVVVALLELLLGRRLNVGLLVDGVVLATLGGVKEDLSSLLDTLEELIILGAALGGLLIGMVLEDLLAVGLLDLILSGLESVLGKAKNLVVVLSLYKIISPAISASEMLDSYLPVFGLKLKHHRVLRLAQIALVAILDLLGALLSLDTVILGESTLVAGSSGVGEEVRSNGLDASLNSLGKLTNGLEVLLGTPAAGESGQRQRNDGSGCHGYDDMWWWM